MIDLHAHLLPGIDDGPHDDDGAVVMARAAVDQGITAMAATPHIDFKHEVAIAELSARLNHLRQMLAGAGVSLEVHQGGEITPTRLLELTSTDLDMLTLGGGRYLLLECPFSRVGQMFDNVVFHAQSAGYEVLLAHPERSPEFLNDVPRLAGLVERGVRVQLTAGSLVGEFGRTVHGAAMTMAAEGLVHVVSSDAHDSVRRPPSLGPAMEALASAVPGSDQAIRYWTHTAPQTILTGTLVEPAPRLRAPRRRLPSVNWLKAKRR